MATVTIAVDLAKNVFEVAGANAAGRIIERRPLSRGQLERFWVLACRPSIRVGSVTTPANAAARARNARLPILAPVPASSMTIAIVQ